MLIRAVLEITRVPFHCTNTVLLEWLFPWYRWDGLYSIIIKMRMPSSRQTLFLHQRFESINIANHLHWWSVVLTSTWMSLSMNEVRHLYSWRDIEIRPSTRNATIAYNRFVCQGFYFRPPDLRCRSSKREPFIICLDKHLARDTQPVIIYNNLHLSSIIPQRLSQDELTHCSKHKELQVTFSSAFSWTYIRFKVRWNLFSMFQLTIY